MTRKRLRWWLELGLALSAVLFFVIATTLYFTGDRNTGILLVAFVSVLNLISVWFQYRRRRNQGRDDG